MAMMTRKLSKGMCILGTLGDDTATVRHRISNTAHSTYPQSLYVYSANSAQQILQVGVLQCCC